MRTSEVGIRRTVTALTYATMLQIRQRHPQDLQDCQVRNLQYWENNRKSQGLLPIVRRSFFKISFTQISLPSNL